MTFKQDCQELTNQINEQKELREKERLVQNSINFNASDPLRSIILLPYQHLIMSEIRKYFLNINDLEITRIERLARAKDELRFLKPLIPDKKMLELKEKESRRPQQARLYYNEITKRVKDLEDGIKLLENKA